MMVVFFWNSSLEIMKLKLHNYYPKYYFSYPINFQPKYFLKIVLLPGIGVESTQHICVHVADLS